MATSLATDFRLPGRESGAAVVANMVISLCLESEVGWRTVVNTFDLFAVLRLGRSGAAIEALPSCFMSPPRCWPSAPF